MDKLKFTSPFEYLKLDHARKASEYDDLALTLMHAQVLSCNGFLRKIYERFYRELMSHLTAPESKTIVELGSGSGFIKKLYPWVRTSDVLNLPNMDYVCDAAALPFKAETIDGILLINVLHHMKDVERFFAEAGRVLKEKGRVVMIEPANTHWARFIYSHFHHEQFDPKSGWRVDGSRPLLDANDALAWIIFTRDKALFDKQFPHLKVVTHYVHTPVAYLLSGGFTLKQLLPAWMYPVIHAIERVFRFTNSVTGMFQTIVLEKTTTGS